jgi:hypothetical protein
MEAVDAVTIAGVEKPPASLEKVLPLDLSVVDWR